MFFFHLLSKFLATDAHQNLSRHPRVQNGGGVGDGGFMDVLKFLLQIRIVHEESNYKNKKTKKV